MAKRPDPNRRFTRTFNVTGWRKKAPCNMTFVEPEIRRAQQDALDGFVRRAREAA